MFKNTLSGIVGNVATSQGRMTSKRKTNARIKMVSLIFKSEVGLKRLLRFPDPFADLRFLSQLKYSG